MDLDGFSEKKLRTPPSLRSPASLPISLAPLTTSTLNMLPPIPFVHGLPPRGPYAVPASTQPGIPSPINRPLGQLSDRPARLLRTPSSSHPAAMPLAVPHCLLRPRAAKRRRHEEEPGETAVSVPALDVPSTKSGSRAAERGRDVGSTELDEHHKPRSGACSRCRRRKLRCDKNAPCAACVMRNEGHACALEAGVVLRETAIADQTEDKLLDRLERLELLLGKIVDKVVRQEAATVHAGTSKNNVDSLSPAQSSSCPEHNGDASCPDSASDRPPRRKKIAPKTEALMTLIRSDVNSTATDMARSKILREVLDLYPDTEAVRTCCTAYFKEADAILPTVNETKFWRQFTKHEAFIRRMRDKEIIWSDSLRPETNFLALVFAVMAVGLIYSLDGLLQRFQSRYENPVFKFLNGTFRLLCAMDCHAHPTLDTLRVHLVTLHVLNQSRASWTCNAFATILAQDALGLKLDLNPPPDCPPDVFYDRMNLWISTAMSECCCALKSGRAPTIHFEKQMATPSFLYSQSSWDQASMDGPWSYLHKYRFELVRIAVASIRRDGMNEDDSFALTIALQSRIDHLRATMPSRIREALEDPFSEGKRMVSALILVRAMHLWFEMALHKRHYARGWTEPKYSLSRRIFHRSALSFIKNFLDYWGDLIQRSAGRKDLDPDTLTENAPGLMFRISPLACAAFTLLVHFERHTQLSEAYPHVVADEEQVEQAQVERLLRDMKGLREKYPCFATIAGDSSSTYSPSPGCLPAISPSNPELVPSTCLPNPPQLVPPLQFSETGKALDFSLLLQQPEVQPLLGTGGPYDGSNGMPSTLQDLFNLFGPMS